MSEPSWNKTQAMIVLILIITRYYYVQLYFKHITSRIIGMYLYGYNLRIQIKN